MAQTDVMINAIIAILSSSVTASIARFYIARSINQLDAVTDKIGGIKEELSAVSVRLCGMENLRQTIIEHESKIAVLESRLR